MEIHQKLKKRNPWVQNCESVCIYYSRSRSSARCFGTIDKIFLCRLFMNFETRLKTAKIHNKNYSCRMQTSVRIPWKQTIICVILRLNFSFNFTEAPKSFLKFPVATIDSKITSMVKQISMILKMKGQRL